MTKTIARITNRRNIPHHKTSTCSVECPSCGFQFHGFPFGGWSAIVCGGCKVELYRNRRSFNAPSAAEVEQAVSNAFARFNAAIENGTGTVEKWNTYGTVFGFMDSRKITLRRIQEIAALHGFTPGVIDGRRADWLAMGGVK